MIAADSAWTILTAVLIGAVSAAPVQKPADNLPEPTQPLRLDLGSGVTMELILLPAGDFLMGSPPDEEGRGTDEGPRHSVRIAEPFYLGKCEVTQTQWKAVMGNTPSDVKGDNLPVTNVSWDDCRQFCRKLSERGGRQIRLPTEAEWEYACRAGTTTAYSFGNSLVRLGDYGGPGKGTYPVGTRKPNPWGLYDVHGNVWEWCADFWHGSYDGAPTNGTARRTSPDAPRRVLRGGSWFNRPVNCRSARRHWYMPDVRYGNLGLRVATNGRATLTLSAALEKARVSGKYAMLLRQIEVEQDRHTYGTFHNWGFYNGDNWAGHTDLPAGNWVYVYPHWYIWLLNTRSPQPRCDWGPEQATGPPDTLRGGDAPTAWSSLTPDDRDEWLMLEYPELVEPIALQIHETLNPGAVHKVTVFDLEGGEHVVWTGRDPTSPDARMGVSTIPFAAGFKANRVRIHLASSKVPGWNEIDAVGLVDRAAQTHWAAAAVASSTYAQPTSGQTIAHRAK